MRSAVPDSSVPPRRSSPWAVVAAFGCLALLAMSAAIGLIYLVRPSTAETPKSRGLQTCTMPDGTLLTLEQVTFGTTHNFEYEKQDSRRSYWFAPRARSIRRLTESTSEPRIKFWLTRHDTLGTALDFDWWSHCVVTDDRGNEFEDDDAGRTSLSTHGGHSSLSGSRPFHPVSPGHYELIVAHSDVRPFRYSNAVFKLRVIDVSGTQVAEFDVRNPHTGSFPEWKPESIPSTKTDGDLAVTLADVRPRTFEGMRDRRKRRMLQLSPQFEIRQGERAAPEWESRRISISDALGNTCGQWDVRLSPSEAAWKLHVLLARNEHGAFSTDEQTIFGPFDLPEKDKTNVVGAKRTLQGITVELLAVGGPGSVTYVDYSIGGGNSSSHNGFSLNGAQGKFVTRTENGKSTVTVESPVPHALFRITHAAPDIDLSVRVTDDQERPVQTATAFNGEMQLWALQTPEDARSIRLTVTAQKMRSVEFLIAPPAARETE
jgi:hypothetical protein